MPSEPPSPGLVREQSCFRSLHWRCDLGAAADVARVARRLAARGWHEIDVMDGLRALRDAAGHEVLIVEATGRVQIRVHYLTPATERRTAAERVYREVTACARAAAVPTSTRHAVAAALNVTDALNPSRNGSTTS